MSREFDDGLRIVLAIAQALREEFGVGIDAHPGGEGNEAGSVNREFVTAAKVIVAAGDDSAGLLTHVLRQVAMRRLTEAGVGRDKAGVLISSEPRLGDRWLAYLALASDSVIDDLTS